MKLSAKLMWLGVLTLLLVPAWLMLRDVGPTAGSRSALAGTIEERDDQQPFDPQQSAALFVGIQHFSADKELPDVQFAVDDAVDLAWTFALDERIRLVDPRHVILALSGTPQKQESKRRLNELITAGTHERAASQPDIVELLQAQADSVGAGGLFIVSFATHGFSDEGVWRLLASSSVAKQTETSITADWVKTIAGRAAGHRSLLLLDACREPEARGLHGGEAGALPAAPLIDAMNHIEGQVALFGAAEGKYAYDDPERRNGVFSAAVIDGLQCEAGVDDRGLITAESLAAHVEKQVGDWIRAHREHSRGSAIQKSMDGQAGGMPLAVCAPRTPLHNAVVQPSRPVISSGPQVARVDVDGSSFTAIGDDGKPLWTREVKGAITHAEAGDLDGDERNDVVVGVGQGGEDAGKIIAFDANGKQLWANDTNASPNYEGGTGQMIVKTFKIGDLFRKHRGEIAVISGDEQGRASRLSIFESSGELVGASWHPGLLRGLVIARRTSYHNPRIIVFGTNDALSASGPVGDLLMYDPKKVGGEAPPSLGKLGSGTHLWCGTVLPATEQIASVEIIDHDRDGHNDISLHTAGGSTLYLDFDGLVLPSESSGRRDIHFELLAPKRSPHTRRPPKHRTRVASASRR